MAPPTDKAQSRELITRFGHYQVISQIGAGGMGKVYLAGARPTPMAARLDCFSNWLLDFAGASGSKHLRYYARRKLALKP